MTKSQHHHHSNNSSTAPKITPQMLTLGLDARDNDTTKTSASSLHGESSESVQQRQTTTGNDKEGRRWWKNVKDRLGSSTKSDASGDSSDDQHAALQNNNISENNNNNDDEDYNARFYTAMDQHDEHSDSFQKPAKARYTSLEYVSNAAGDDERVMNKQKQTKKKQQYQRIHQSEASQESLLQQDDQQKKHATENSSQQQQQQQQPLSREEALQRDCSFFYRDMDEATHQQHRRKNKRNSNYRPRTASWRAMVRDPNSTAGLSQPSFEYSAAVDIMTPPVLQRYRTKFAQLNQEILLQPRSRRSIGDTTATAGSSHDDLDVYDLQLTTVTSDDLLQQDHIVLTDTVETSSLFFQLADKTVMRLPRDQVRLLMDQDLEAGILSVEQWRAPDELPDETWNTRHSMRLEKFQKPFDERHPALHYVLTVEDNLYRKVVQDMSDHLTEPFYSPRRWCLEDKKVDIRVAILLLVIVLLIIFFTTIERPT